MPCRTLSFSSIKYLTLVVIPATALAMSNGDDPPQKNYALQLAAEINPLITNLPQKGVSCSALIVDLQSGSTVVSHQATKLMIPASNQKILVLAAAIDQLPSQFEFRTTLAQAGNDLRLVADGDPTLGDPEVAGTSDDPLTFIDDWARTLTSTGHSTIAGNFLVDTSILDEEFVHPTWEDSDLIKWYGAPAGALNISNNCILLTANPGPSAGEPALWTLTPPCPLVEVTNRCVTTDPANNDVPLVGRRKGTFELTLSGKVSRTSALQRVSMPDPNRFASAVIRERLTAGGVSIAGQTLLLNSKTDNMPSAAAVIGVKATPLASVLSRIGRDSQNMCAEALMKRLGYEWSRRHNVSPAQGSWPTGRKALKQMLTKLGCDFSQLTIADGSGLSRDNRITADYLVRVLTYMYAHEQRKTFLNSLAGNRTGGTLRRRTKAVPGEVYAKTGYMSGVRCLTGYVRSLDDHWYAFSIMFNGFRGSSAPYNRIQMEICKILSAPRNGSAE